MVINVRYPGSNARSTARIHRAGAAAIAGAIALAASLIGHGVAGYLGTDSMIDTPGTLAYYLSYGSLAVAWGLLFLGSLGFVVPPAILEETVEAIPDAELAVIEGARHGAFYTHKPSFEKRVLAFLDG